MPPAPPTAEPAARTWWSLSRSPSSKDLRHAYAHEKAASRPPIPVKAGKLNSFATAIGLKSKKQSPSLTIEDPPATLVQFVSNSASTPASPASSTNRPPSKSVSSSRSRVDSMEPRTPIDYQRDHRHSLLTLSDTDPFAGRPMIAVPVPQLPHLPSDPNRLSAYSNPSVTEFVQKKADVPTFNRVSYASSSSNSNYHTLDIPTSPIPTKVPELRTLKSKRSTSSLQFKRPELLHRQASVTPSMTSGSSHSKAGSSSTVVGQNQSDASRPTRPKLRIRGMTDSGTSARAGFFVEERPSLRKTSPKSSSSNIPSPQESSTLTRVVKRQVSNSRIHPPTAPPKHKLPAPPAPLSSLPPIPSQDAAPMPSRMGLGGRASASSSSLSFASSDSFAGSPYGVADRDKRSSQRSAFAYEPGPPDSPISFVQPNESKTAPSSPRTLKKALSHQSLTRIGLASPPLPASPAPKPPATAPGSSAEKGVRKQRSFHHPRLPIPAIPLPIRTSSLASSKVFPSSGSCAPESAGSLDKRRGSTATSISSRRRLFSNSSRPATSHHPPTTPEDDALSVFSLRSDNDSHLTPYKPWINKERQMPSASSFWDEGGSDNVPSSPVRSTVDFYTPQAIMSRAELAKLEASVDSRSIERSATRSRGYSIMSSSTVLSDMTQDSDVVPIGLSPPPSSRPSSKQTSMRMNGSPFSPPGPSSRPQSIVSNQDDHHQHRPPPLSLVSTIQGASRVVAVPDITSLPPPPRRRKPTITTELLKASADGTPPPSSSSSRPASANSAMPTPSLMASPTLTPMPSRSPSLLKPGSKPGSMRSKLSFEKGLHRQSIMRKPSFLDIDDDTDQEYESAVDGQMGGSFLDLARESFDSVRTDR